MAYQEIERSPFAFACPLCGAALHRAAADLYTCPQGGQQFPQVEGIWRFLPPPLAGKYTPFIQSYEDVRRAEGWDQLKPGHFRQLPFTYGSSRYQEVWRIRVGSYRVLMSQIVAPLASRQERVLQVLDLGAGTGWLSYRLAGAGHQSAAVDLITNDWDGLGAWKHYATEALFLPVQAAFDYLPFAQQQADLVIFNGAVHYARDYATTLKETLRLLRPGGQIVIMDSPFYRNGASGVQMVREKEAQFREMYGVELDEMPAENFLTPARLAALSSNLGVSWRLLHPFRGLRWTLQRWQRRLRARREPASFPIIIGKP